MASKVVLVTGASGNIGKAALAALGKYSDTLAVRAGVRDPVKSADLSSAASNVTVVAADPLDSAQIGQALKGVDYLFVVAPGHAERAKIINAAVDEGKAAGIKFVLVVSGSTADLTDTIFGKHWADIESHVKASGVPYAFIRLPLFMDNEYANIGTIKGQGTWYGGVEPEKPFTPVAVQDIAAVAAKILSDPSAHLGKTYKLTATADTYANLAKYYSDALGKPVTYTHVNFETVRQGMKGAGFEDWLIDGIIELGKLINSDSPFMNDPEGGKDIEAILGRPATSFQAWVESAAPAFK